MAAVNHSRSFRRAVAGAAVIAPFIWLAPARAERLPIHVWTAADGLAHDTVNRLIQDSRGYLWICTENGLSRYDGHAFTNYLSASGLPDPTVMDLLEARDGTYWVATLGGLYRFDATRTPRPGIAHDAAGPVSGRHSSFTFMRLDTDPQASQVRVLFENSKGIFWAGTDRGLYRIDRANGTWSPHRIPFPVPRSYPEAHQVNALLEDGVGSLWIGTRELGLLRLRADGRLDLFTTANGMPSNRIWSFRLDAAGGLWVATKNGGDKHWKGGVCHVVPAGDSIRVDRIITDHDGLPSADVHDVTLTKDGDLYAATSFGLAMLPRATSPVSTLRTYGREQGLVSAQLSDLMEDRDGNLWIGSDNGLMRLSRGGFTTYGTEDGLEPGMGVSSILEDADGTLCVISRSAANRDYILHSMEDGRFVRTRVNLPRYVGGWGAPPVALRDSRGDWLFRTGKGLFEFRSPSSSHDLARMSARRFTTREGLFSDGIKCLHEDRQGMIWISSWHSGFSTSPLARWDPRTGRILRLCGGQLSPKVAADDFAEDRAGNLWIGSYGSGLYRFRRGRFEHFTHADGVPSGGIALHLDAAGRVWIGTEREGVVRVDDPDADKPRFVTYTTAEGLGDNGVESITEDAWGRLYFVTDRGVDRLDPVTGHVRQYTAADGLPGHVALPFRDHRGDLWFSAGTSVARLTPRLEAPRAAPCARITAVRVAGAPWPVSPLGDTALAGLVLGPHQQDVEIEFAGVSLVAGEMLRYQYRLEGSSKDWSAPSPRRAVDYANLAPGRYRFAVRTVTSDSSVGASVATVSFRILPPVWRQWWFIAGAAALASALAWTLHRWRLARVVELERVRTRIGTDLHDEIGSSLSQIAVQSEVLRRSLEHSPEGSQRAERIEEARRLGQIARVSSELVDAMSDIVWAINPKRDRVGDLVQRMRRFGLDTLDARGIRLRFTAPPVGADTGLDAERRRQVYMVFKEAVTNASRHSGAREVAVSLTLERGALTLVVEDDGRGLYPDGGRPDSRGGTGLFSMRRRAETLGGRLEIVPGAGGGTRVEMRIPLGGRLRVRRERPIER